jgi:hypothetical protein
MFTNCPINEILSAVRIAYDDFDKANLKIKWPPTDDLIYLLKSVLENNIFEFNGQLFQQIIGAAIVAIPSCEACVFLCTKLWKKFCQSSKVKRHIFLRQIEMTASLYTMEISMTSLIFFSMTNNHHFSLNLRMKFHKLLSPSLM